MSLSYIPSGIGKEISNMLLLSHRKDDDIVESDMRVPACKGSWRNASTPVIAYNKHNF